VVLASETRNGVTRVIVAPCTTQPPRGGQRHVELPIAVKAHLSLDDRRCWIVTDELNQFIWPGPDVRLTRIGTSLSPYFGKLPSKLFEQIQTAIGENVSRERIALTKRTK
jgi:mRNA-degrading endonuclease toxin of MazEF toxin-antitoxin module